MAGDLSVGAGATLTIEPGVTLEFATTDLMGGGLDDAKPEFIVVGQLDAVIVNRNTTGLQDWDVGVLNRSGVGDYYYTEWEKSTVFLFGETLVTDLAYKELARIFEVHIEATELGWITVEVVAASPDEVLHLSYFAQDFTTGILSDAVTTGTTVDGQRRIYCYVTQPGYHREQGVQRVQAVHQFDAALCRG